MMRRHSVPVRLVFVPIALLALSSCSDGTETPETPRPVRFIKVESSDAARQRTFSGTARAGTEARLSFKVAGTIEHLPVVVGSRVRQGDLIAALDPNDYLLREQEALAGLRQAEAQARNAEETYERVKGLYENNNASRGELEAARAGSESAKQSVRLASSRLEQARLQVGYTRLTAPSDGAIAQIEAEVNENVSPGQTVVVLTAGERAEVRVAVPEQLISRISLGDSVSVTFDAIVGRSYEAVVHEVGVATTGTATTYPVSVVLDEAVPDLRPGMAAEVTFSFVASDARSLGIVVPSSAVGEDRAGRFVFTLEPSEGETAVARRRPVSLGSITSQGIEVLEGLDEGALVATAGVSYLSDGQQVRLLDRGFRDD